MTLNVYPSLIEWVESNLSDLDMLVFDIDGVLMLDQKPTPGSGELLSLLKSRGVPFSMITNDSNHSVREKASFLRATGLEVSPEEIVSAGDGLLGYVRQQGLEGSLFFVMGDLGRPNYAEQAGLRVTGELSEIADCAGVIVGEDHYDWEAAINGAVNFFIRHPKARFVSPNPDEYFPRAGGRIHIGAGGVARFVCRVLAAYGVAVEPVFLGKPYTPVFEYNHRRAEARTGRRLDPKRVVMAGDFLDADIKGANGFGYRSALVLTGVTDLRTLHRSDIRPELVFERL